jgi:hypothetical protein
MGKWGTSSRFAALCALALIGGCAVHDKAVVTPPTIVQRPDDDFSCKRS